MCQILLSIKPEYVEHILSGDKRYEYRKQRCKRAVDKILIYSTHPVKKIVAEVCVSSILENSPQKVWELTKNFSGISKEFFDSYYKGRNTAVAFELGDLKVYDPPLSLDSLGVSSAPQSFLYLPG